MTPKHLEEYRMKKLCDSMIDDFIENPSLWDWFKSGYFTSSYQIQRTGSNTTIWVGNGFWFYSIHQPAKYSFTFFQKIRFHLAFQRWLSAERARTRPAQLESIRDSWRIRQIEFIPQPG